MAEYELATGENGRWAYPLGEEIDAYLIGHYPKRRCLRGKVSLFVHV